MKNYILAIVAALIALPATAQFTFQGKIEYERKSNVHRQLEDMMTDDDEDDNSSRDWLSKIKSQVPKFKSTFFDYSFNQNAGFYKPGREVDNPTKGWGSSPAESNEVYTDFTKGRVAANKQVFEQKYLIDDSMRVIDWKIMDEIRIVANYKCRKAVGRICDSVYVVAFYADDIPVSGGPEMFSGLPGMILELAVPRLYTTWIATKVEMIPPTPEEMKVPQKGKKVTQQKMHEDLMASISKWGRWAHRSIWWSML